MHIQLFIIIFVINVDRPTLFVINVDRPTLAIKFEAKYAIHISLL